MHKQVQTNVGRKSPRILFILTGSVTSLSNYNVFLTYRTYLVNQGIKYMIINFNLE